MTSGDLRWAVDGRGQVTSDPVEAMREGAGLPLGGEEQTGGYKGYGLALMVEVLCGVMSGVTNVKISADHDNTSHCQEEPGARTSASGVALTPPEDCLTASSL